MIPSAAQGNPSSQIMAPLANQGAPISIPAEKRSSIESQKQPPEQPGSEKPRQTLCAKIAAFFKWVWDFLFGTDGEGGTDHADETPPPVPADETIKPPADKKKPAGCPRTPPGALPPAGGKKDTPPPPELKPPERASRKLGEPLKLYNFGPHADANVCWLNSLAQILFA